MFKSTCIDFHQLEFKLTLKQKSMNNTYKILYFNAFLSITNM